MSWRLGGRELTSQGAQGELDLVSRLNCAVGAKITARYPALRGEYSRTRVACKSNDYIIFFINGDLLFDMNKGI